MSDDWNDYAEGWDDDPFVKQYADRAFASLISYQDIRGPDWASKRVLDFGCGTGAMAKLVAPYVAQIVAVDTAPRMIAVLAAKGIDNVEPIAADVLEADVLQDAGFDLIYASSVCGFLPNYSAAVRTLAGLLKPGARFIQWDWQATGDEDTGLTAAQIEAALSKAQLRSVKVGPAFDLGTAERTMRVLAGTGLA